MNNEVPDRRMHREARPKRQRRNDQEPAAGPHEAGEASDSEALQEQPARRPSGCAAGASRAASLPHPHRRQHHHACEEQQQQRPIEERPYAAAEVGARHPRRSKEKPRSNVDVARPPVVERSGRAGRAHHEQRACDRSLRIEAEHVNEQRHRENRATAAKKTQRDPDQDAQPETERRHSAALPAKHRCKWKHRAAVCMLRRSNACPSARGFSRPKRSPSRRAASNGSAPARASPLRVRAPSGAR